MQTENNQTNYIDQFHEYIIRFWKYLVGLAIIVILSVSSYVIYKDRDVQKNQSDANLYYQYINADKATQTKIASDMKISYFTNYKLLIALWEVKKLVTEEKYTEALRLLRWASKRTNNVTTKNLLLFREALLCYQLNDSQCVKVIDSKLTNTSYKPLINYISALTYIENNSKTEAKDSLKSAMRTAGSPVFKLIIEQTEKAIK